MNIFAPLNNLIETVYQAGLSQTIYDAWNLVDFALIAVFCLIYRKHYGISRAKSVLIPFVIYVLSAVLIRLIGWAATGFTVFGPNNVVKGFSFFPLFGLLVAKMFKMDFKRIMDFTAPCFPMLQFIGHIVCVLPGCCYGYPMHNGIWNPDLQIYCFPNQFLESFVALLIVIACILIAKKNDYKVTGKMYPFFLITFGATRFFLEFLRDNDKLFWGISELALWALLMVAVGITWLLIDKYGKPKTAEVAAEAPVQKKPAANKSKKKSNKSKKKH